VLRDPTTDSYQVFTVENGAAHLKVVVPGESDAATTRIATGLSGSETVATGRLNQLFDGAPVDASSR
jgi:hypothetical protein